MITYVYLAVCAAICLALQFPVWQVMVFTVIAFGGFATYVGLSLEARAKVTFNSEGLSEVASFLVRVLPLFFVMMSVALRSSGRAA